MARSVWMYDEKSGGLYCGAKLVTHFFDHNGRPYASNEAEAAKFGHRIAKAMNEDQNKRRAPGLGRARDVK